MGENLLDLTFITAGAAACPGAQADTLPVLSFGVYTDIQFPVCNPSPALGAAII